MASVLDYTCLPCTLLTPFLHCHANRNYSGIGKAIACRLARDGFNIVAVGRDKPGRREEMLAHLAACSQSDEARHEFRPCDAFSLAQVKACAEGVASDYAREGIDALV